MKKLIGLVTILAVILFGCSKSDEVVTECILEMEGFVSNVKLTAEGDQLISNNTVIERSYEAFDISKEEFLESGALYASGINTDGVEYEYEGTDEIYTEKVTIDYTKADLDELVKIGLLVLEGEVPDNVDMDSTVKGFESAGFICTEK